MKRNFIGMMLVVLGVVMCGKAATTWELVDDFSGPSIDTSKWAVTTQSAAGSSSVTIVDGQMRAQTNSGTVIPYGVAYSALKKNDTTALSLSMFEDDQFSFAVDFQVNSATTNQFGNGIQLRRTSDNAVVACVNVYGTTQASLIGNMTNDYKYGAASFSGVFNHFHAEFTLSVGGASVKVWGYDSQATSPGDYTWSPLAEWALSVSGAPALSSAEETFNVFLCGTYSNETSKVSIVDFDNVYTNIPEPVTMGLLCVGAIGITLRRRHLR